MTHTDPKYPTLEWVGDLRFTAKAADRPEVLLDGHGEQGPSPVNTMLLAAGACAGSDVVDILKKKRVELAHCRIRVRGRRAEEYPRRFLELWLTFHVAGEGLTREKAERAVELSVTKYCSVLLSLNPDIPIHTEVVIE
jgi:putative redox protein